MATTSRYQQIPSNIHHLVMEKKEAAVLVFGAEWSGDTVIMDSIMNRIGKNIDSSIQFFKVDTEKNKDIFHFFNVSTIPTTIILKDGEIAELIIGFLPANRIQDKIMKIYFG